MKGTKTYCGIAVLLIPALLKTLDIEVSGAEIQTLIDQALALFGGAMAIYGRYDATK